MKKHTAFLLIFPCFPFMVVYGQQPKLILPVGHTNIVYDVTFSPDSKKIVTASFDHTAKIWDAETGILLLDLREHQSSLSSANFSPDGRKVVTTSWDQSVKIWDAVNGKLLFDLKGHHDPVMNAVFSHDGKKILSYSDFAAKIWDVATGKLIHDFKDFKDIITAAVFSPDNKKIATASKDRSVRIFNVFTGALLFTLNKHTRKITEVLFTPDNKKLVTAANDGTACIWDIQTGTLINEIAGHQSGISAVGLSTDANKLVTASLDSTIKLWDLTNNSFLFDLKGKQGNLSTVAFTVDNKRLITAGSDGIAKVWNALSGELVSTNRIHDSMLISMDFSPDRSKIVTGDVHKAIIWDLERNKKINEFKGHTASVNTVVVSPDKKLIATASDDGIARMWDARNGQLVKTLTASDVRLFSASFNPDGTMLITASEDSTAAIWNVETGMMIFRLIGHTELVWKAEFSRDGKKILTVANDNAARLWDAETGKLLFALEGHTSNVSSAAFSYDGKKIVTSSEHLIKVWDAQTGRLLNNLEGHKGNINSTVFTPDGTKIFSSSWDSTAILWDIVTGNPLRTLKAHTNTVYDASIRPDGKQMVTASFDGTARVWDINGNHLFTLVGHTDFVDGARYTSDGKKIITIATDQTSKIWESSTGKLLHTLKGHLNYIKDVADTDDYFLTASTDNTIKKWDAKSGRLLYTFFGVDSSDYLLLDNYDRYDGSAAARKLLYFSCAPEIIDLTQVKDQLWVPQLAERINKGEQIQAKKLSELDLCGFTPETENLPFSNGMYRFSIKPRRGGIGETILSVNGIQVKKYQPSQLIKKGTNYELNVPEGEVETFLVTGQRNQLSIRSFTADNNIASRGLGTFVTEKKETAPPPNLYAVIIGISDYKETSLDLRFAAKDAMDISRVIASSARKLLNTDGKEHVFMYELTTAAERYQLPEKNAIKNLFDEIAKKAAAQDILLIFFAGHGKFEPEKKQFYFLTADASPASAIDAIEDVGISTAELTEWMRPSIIKAQKRILIFDACNSGQLIRDFIKIGNPDQDYMAARSDDKAQFTKAIDKLNEQSGFLILSAAASTQLAYEISRYSQGLLTYALLKAVKLQPDILEGGKYLDVSRWFNAAEKTVSQISQEISSRQQPQVITNTNFNLGIVDNDVIAQVMLSVDKPVLSTSIFLNDDAAVGDDDLELSRMINSRLAEISNATDNKLLYVTSSGTPGIYNLTGRYEVKGNTVMVKVNLKQDKAIKNRFEVSGSTNKLKELVNSIIDKALESAR